MSEGPTAVMDVARTYSYTFGHTDLLSGPFGTQDAVVMHPIIPAGWQVTRVFVTTITAFNGAGTRALNIGVTGALTGIVSALDIKSAGIKNPSETMYRSTAPIAITAQFVTGTDNPTEGEVSVTLELVKVGREN